MPNAKNEDQNTQKTLTGTNGNDVLTSTDATFVINAGNGDDTVVGGTNSETIHGGNGNDTLSGGAGDDAIFGNNGFDVAAYSGSVLGYSWEDGKGNATVVADIDPTDGNDGTDTLKQISRLDFKDYSLFIDGTNNAVFAAEDATSTDENEAVAFDVLANDLDFDGDQIFLTSVMILDESGSPTTDFGRAEIVDSVIQWEPLTDFDYLASGETANVELSYSVTDGKGGDATGSIIISVVGTNDDVQLISGDFSGSVQEAENNSADEVNNFLHIATGSFLISDLDYSDQHEVTVIGSQDFLGSLTVNYVSQSGSSADRELNWQFSVNDADLDALDGGDSLTQSYTIRIDDLNGSAIEQDVSILLEGADDALPPVAQADNFDINLHGPVLFDLHSGTNSTTFGGVTYYGDYSSGGEYVAGGRTLGWAYRAQSYSGSDYFLDPLQDIGGDPTKDLGLSVSGHGQASLSAYIVDYSESFSILDISLFSVEPDHYDSGFARIGAYMSNGSITLTSYDQNSWSAEIYSASVFTSIEGMSTSEALSLLDGEYQSVSLSMVLRSTSDTPNSETIIAGFDTLVVGPSGASLEPGVENLDLLVNDADSDDLPLLVDTTSLLPTSALGSALSVNSDGTVRYDTTQSVAIGGLTEGESALDTFTYRVTNGTLLSEPTDVFITVTGKNDAPVLNLPTGPMLIINESESGSVSLLPYMDDVDSNHNVADLEIEVLSNSSNGLVSSSAGTLAFSTDEAFEHLSLGESASITTSIRVVDPLGLGSASADLQILINGENDAPGWNVPADLAITALLPEGMATLDLKNYAFDIDSDDDSSSLTYTIVEAPDSGIASIDNGLLSFNTSGLTGNEAVSIAVMATDSHGASSSVLELPVVLADAIVDFDTGVATYSENAFSIPGIGSGKDGILDYSEDGFSVSIISSLSYFDQVLGETYHSPFSALRDFDGSGDAEMTLGGPGLIFERDQFTTAHSTVQIERSDGQPFSLLDFDLLGLGGDANAGISITASNGAHWSYSDGYLPGEVDTAAVADLFQGVTRIDITGTASAFYESVFVDGVGSVMLTNNGLAIDNMIFSLG